MRISLQLYTVRDALAKDLQGTLDKVRDIGLKYVEFAGYYDQSASDWKTLVTDRGLTFSAAHIGFDQIRDDFDEVVENCKIMGVETVVVPWIGEDHYKDGWDAFGRVLQPIGQMLKKEGLQLAYHNHAFEFKTDGLVGLYGATSPDILKAQLDLAWVSIGGADPVDYIHRFADRTTQVHLKDYDPTKTPQWRPAGQGILDWDPIIAACLEAGVQYGSIELDESPGDPIEAVRESFNYFAAKGLN
jgi:sugar phosphate isomerase/epimerase